MPYFECEEHIDGINDFPEKAEETGRHQEHIHKEAPHELQYEEVPHEEVQYVEVSHEEDPLEDVDYEYISPELRQLMATPLPLPLPLPLPCRHCGHCPNLCACSSGQNQHQQQLEDSDESSDESSDEEEEMWTKRARGC